MRTFERPTRRLPVARERYRAVARHTGIRKRLRRPIAILDGVVLVLASGFLLVAGPYVGDAVGAGVGELRAQVAEMFPALQGSKAIELPSGGTAVAAEPVAKDLPDFTREPALALTGRVPSFALAPGRTVSVALNGAIVASLTPDAAGAFATPLTLREGPNAISLTLLASTDIVARSSYTVVLDRQPPTLVVASPANGETVDGPNVTVQGKAEAGATVVVNDRTVLPAPDGTFRDSFSAPVGPLALTVVARDRAGNETTVKSSITVRAPAATTGLAVTVTLNRTRVAPGTFVIAEIRVSANGTPRAGEQVALSVGVIAIGSATTDASGVARIGFAAPPNEGEASVIVIANGATGRATLTVAK